MADPVKMKPCRACGKDVEVGKECAACGWDEEAEKTAAKRRQLERDVEKELEAEREAANGKKKTEDKKAGFLPFSRRK